VLNCCKAERTRFWKYIHPQWSILDPKLHSIRFVRERSAFLFTVILAIGSTALATLPDGTEESVRRAIQLQAHAEKVLLVAFAIGAKSCEIIQAHILFHMWSFVARRYVDDQRWVRMAMCSRMALELGLHRRRNLATLPGIDPRLVLNDVRIRAFLIIAENRYVNPLQTASPNRKVDVDGRRGYTGDIFSDARRGRDS
jgi:hypothetical protein